MEKGFSEQCAGCQAIPCGSFRRVHQDERPARFQLALASFEDTLRSILVQIEKGRQRLAQNIEDYVKKESSLAHSLSSAPLAKLAAPSRVQIRGVNGARRERQQEQTERGPDLRSKHTEGSVVPSLGPLSLGPGGGFARSAQEEGRAGRVRIGWRCLFAFAWRQ